VAGLPDGLFSDQKSQFLQILEGLGMLVFCFDHLEYFTAIWYNLWPFGIVCGHLVDFLFPVLVCLDREKSGSPGLWVSYSDLCLHMQNAKWHLGLAS
jgi:hypothetical protein